MKQGQIEAESGYKQVLQQTEREKAEYESTITKLQNELEFFKAQASFGTSPESSKFKKEITFSSLKTTPNPYSSQDSTVLKQTLLKVKRHYCSILLITGSLKSEISHVKVFKF